MLIATAFMWGTNLLVFRQFVTTTDPMVFNFIRLVPATLTLGFLWCVQRRHRAGQRKNSGVRLPWVRLFFYALINGLLYQVIFAKGLSLTHASTAALIIASMPMWTAVLSLVFLSERLGTARWAGLFITLAGTCIIVLGSDSQVRVGGEFLIGNLLMLGSAVAWAGATVISKPILDLLSPVSLAFFSALITLPIHAWIAWPILSKGYSELLNPEFFAAAIYAGAFSSGIAFATWHYGVRTLGASHASIYQNLVTLIAVVGGWLLLSEPMMVAQLFGGGLSIMGIIMMRRGNTPRNDVTTY